MPKRVNKTRRHKKGGKRRTMRGGAFDPQEVQALIDMGFSHEQVDNLDNMNISINNINQAINYYNQNFHEIIIQLAQQMNNVVNQNNNIDNDDNMDNDNNQSSVMSSLHDSDLMGDNDNDNDNDLGEAIPHNLADMHNIDNDNDANFNMDDNYDEGDTSRESNDFSFGGRRRSKKNKFGKKRRTKRKMKGGTCYGTGVGANSYDPNLSIYNTNMLKLFPYRA